MLVCLFQRSCRQTEGCNVLELNHNTSSFLLFKQCFGIALSSHCLGWMLDGTSVWTDPSLWALKPFWRQQTVSMPKFFGVLFWVFFKWHQMYNKQKKNKNKERKKCCSNTATNHRSLTGSDASDGRSVCSRNQGYIRELKV